MNHNMHQRIAHTVPRALLYRCIPALLFLALLLTLPASAQTDEDLIRHAPWRTREAWPGVTWKFHHFENLFGSRQSIHVAEVDPAAPGVQLSILFLERGLKRPSAFARETSGTLLAVNGNFFNTKTGGSVCFLRVANRIINPTEPVWLDSGAVAIAESGLVSILQKPPADWPSVTDQRDIIANGPILVWDGAPLTHWGEETFFTARHPRTAAGTTPDNRLILLTVDGRTTQAAGMSCAELARTMAALGCVRAVNLDGGGSTTMWVRGEPDNGVVNYPCDNRRYDHEGERACANVIAVLGPPDQSLPESFWESFVALLIALIA